MKQKQKIREQFRIDVFKRDKNKCVMCGAAKGKLDAHHITDRNLMPNGGYVKENGITLCEDKCHIKAEKFHITEGKEWEDGFHPNDLYKKIGVSYDKAYKSSLKLE